MKQYLVVIAVVLVAAFSRLAPHPANFTPVAAIALVSGAYLNRRYALVIPAVAMLLSDIVIGFHSLMPFVYGSFLFSGLIGMWLKRRRTPFMILSGTVGSSILFFIVTNLGVWLLDKGQVYPMNWAGLVDCYTLAIPFFRNTITGDLLYASALFGIFEFVYRKLGSFDLAEVPATK